MREFIAGYFPQEMVETVYYICIAVLALIVLLLVLWIIRAVRRPGLSQRRDKQARLAVTDAVALYDERRLVLLRRDNVEHLILIGGTTDIVIESGIEAQKAFATAAKSGQIAQSAAQTAVRTESPAPKNNNEKPVSETATPSAAKSKADNTPYEQRQAQDALRPQPVQASKDSQQPAVKPAAQTVSAPAASQSKKPEARPEAKVESDAAPAIMATAGGAAAGMAAAAVSDAVSTVAQTIEKTGVTKDVLKVDSPYATTTGGALPVSIDGTQSDKPSDVTDSDVLLTALDDESKSTIENISKHSDGDASNSDLSAPRKPDPNIVSEMDALLDKITTERV